MEKTKKLRLKTKKLPIFLTILLFILQFTITADSEQDHSKATAAQPQATGACTPGACMYCNTDGKSKWCETCGNGKVINTNKGHNRYCTSQEITVANCYQTDTNQPDNPDTCSECRRGYYLADRKTCSYINFPNCDIPVKEGNVFRCYGCEGQFLKDDLSGCGVDDGLPANCLFGGKETDKNCRVCNPGYRLVKKSIRNANITGICVPDEVEGCQYYHSSQPGKCVLCDYKRGYYAVDAEMGVDKAVYQTCQYFSGVITVYALIGLLFFGHVF
jgi:hypothetical protein